jgi:hypothetical protein
MSRKPKTREEVLKAVEFVETVVETIRDDERSSVVLDTLIQAEALATLCERTRTLLQMGGWDSENDCETCRYSGLSVRDMPCSECDLCVPEKNMWEGK